MANMESADKNPAGTHGREQDGPEQGGPEQGGPETIAAAGSRDVESDPALNDALGQDWSDEGGATPEGAATSSD